MKTPVRSHHRDDCKRLRPNRSDVSEINVKFSFWFLFFLKDLERLVTAPERTVEESDPHTWCIMWIQME